MILEKPSESPSFNDSERALIAGYFSNGSNTGGPQHFKSPASKDYCEELKQFYRISYMGGLGASGFAGYFLGRHWDHKASLHPIAFATPLITATGAAGAMLWMGKSAQNTYDKVCQDPPPPNYPRSFQKLEIPVKSSSGQTLHLRDDSLSNHWGWAILGGVCLLAAGALLLIPFDGPAGEMAAGTASLAAFAKAGMISET